jgi:hypothetical protein
MGSGCVAMFPAVAAATAVSQCLTLRDCAAVADICRVTSVGIVSKGSADMRKSS